MGASAVGYCPVLRVRRRGQQACIAVHERARLRTSGPRHGDLGNAIRGRRIDLQRETNVIRAERINGSNR